jgi:hypothetical protein
MPAKSRFFLNGRALAVVGDAPASVEQMAPKHCKIGV